jgi:hypothetical protein
MPLAVMPDLIRHPCFDTCDVAPRWIADQVRNDRLFVHVAQMQACPRASAGNCSSSSLVKVAWVHQQGGWVMPVTRSTSIAH